MQITCTVTYHSYAIQYATEKVKYYLSSEEISVSSSYFIMIRVIKHVL